jgi:DnaJ-class molecular chaperone
MLPRYSLAWSIVHSRSNNQQLQPVRAPSLTQGPAELRAKVFDDENNDDCMDLCDAFRDENESSVVPPQPTLSPQQQQHGQVQKDRIRLEMKWEMYQNKDDCDLEDLRSCSEPCQECHGSGNTPCRFCLGTKQIHLIGSNSQPCPVCNETGAEVCQKCRGTGKLQALLVPLFYSRSLTEFILLSGWVASWTELANFF